MIEHSVKRSLISQSGKRGFLAFAMILSLGLAARNVSAQSVSFAWDSVTNANVAGYEIQTGTDGTNFPNSLDAGMNTQATLTNLVAGATNYFQVVAYDQFGHQGAPSVMLSLFVTNNPPPAQNEQNSDTNSSGVSTTNNSGGTDTNSGAENSVTTNSGNAETNAAPEAPEAPATAAFTNATYYGLFYATSNAAEQSSGSLRLTTAKSGAFTARLQLPGQSHPFSGKFSEYGAATKTIARPGLPPITIELQLSPTNGTLTGTVSEGTWTSDLSASTASYSRNNPAAQAGKYTLLIPGSEDAATQPGGTGFGSVVVNARGLVTFRGMLGDGTPFATSSAVAENGQWPLYISLYGGKGSILGWVSITNDGVGGQLGWFKIASPLSKLYPAGFTSSAEAVGSAYRYTNNVPTLNFADGLLTLTNGNFQQGVTSQVVLNKDKVESSPSSGISLTLRPATGLFTGKAFDPSTGKSVVVNGAILQNQNLGGGVFVGKTESGSVLLSPAQ
jgi:hypothetical protein